MEVFYILLALVSVTSLEQHTTVCTMVVANVIRLVTHLLTLTTLGALGRDLTVQAFDCRAKSETKVLR